MKRFAMVSFIVSVLVSVLCIAASAETINDSSVRVFHLQGNKSMRPAEEFSV